MAIFTNQASLSYNDVTVNSNVATGELLEVLSAEASVAASAVALVAAASAVAAAAQDGKRRAGVPPAGYRPKGQKGSEGQEGW